MDSINSKISDTILAIEEICNYIIMDKPVAMAKALPGFSELLLEIFPAIVESYMRPDLADVKDDMQYWTTQLERIIAAIQGGDSFLIIDVLWHETKSNLELYQKMMEEKGW